MYNENDIWRKIKTRREEIGLTQTELAERVNGSSAPHSQIAGWEKSGGPKPSTSSLLRLCIALDCDLEYLIDDDVQVPKKMTHDAMAVTGLSRRAVEELQCLNESTSFFSKIDLKIVDELLSNCIFWREVIPCLRVAWRTMQGVDSPDNLEFAEAVAAVNLFNQGGYTNYTVYSGEHSALLQIQSATNATQNAYKQIIIGDPDK